MPPLLKQKLNEKDTLAFNLHVNHILNNKWPRNVILDNFCKRVKIDIHDFIRWVRSPHWKEIEKEEKIRGYLQ